MSNKIRFSLDGMKPKRKKEYVPEPLTDLDYLLLIRLHIESGLRKENAVRAARAVKLEFNQQELQGQIPQLVIHNMITINNTWCRLTPEGRAMASDLWDKIKFNILRNV